MSDPPAPQVDAALGLYVKLMRASRAVLAAAEPSIHDSGLTLMQFAVLEALLHKGRLSHGELRSKVLTSPANMTDVIDKLQARGLLTRCRQGEDARRIAVELTPAGRCLIAGAFAHHAEQIRAVIGRIDPCEQAQLAGLLRKLGLAASEVPPK